MANNVVDNEKELEALIKAKSGTEEDEGEITAVTTETVTHTLNLGSEVLSSYGYASFVRDEENYGMNHFEIGLGPANSKLMIEFLLSLPPEPDEEDDDDEEGEEPAGGMN